VTIDTRKFSHFLKHSQGIASLTHALCLFLRGQTRRNPQVLNFYGCSNPTQPGLAKLILSLNIGVSTSGIQQKEYQLARTEL